MTVKIRENSRLGWSRLLNVGGVECWELPEYPTILADDTDTFYTADTSDRIDKLAERFYGNRELWWVIALANGLRLLPSDLYQGQILRIPAFRRVMTDILRRPSRGREGR